MADDDALDTTIQTFEDNLDAYIQSVGHISMEPVIDKLISYLSGNDVLSIGCGYGRDEEVFADKGIAVSGIDLSSTMLGEAKRRIPSGSFSVMDMRKLGLADESFDGIYCSASLHHLARDDSPDALSEMHRVLRDDGAMYIMVKEGTGEASRTVGTGKVRETFYEEDEFDDLLDNAGFDILKKQFALSSVDNNQLRWLKYFCRKR